MSENIAPWVGFFTVAGLILLAALTFFVDDEGKIQLQKQVGVEYTIRFRNAGGLLKGAQVYRDGVKVGKVIDVDVYDGTMPTARIEMLPKRFIYSNDVIQLQVSSIISSGQDIHLSTSAAGLGTPYPPGKELLSASAVSITGAVGSISGFFDDAQILIRTVQSDYDSQFKPTLVNLRESSDQLVKGDGTLHQLLYEKEFHDEALKLVRDDLRPAAGAIRETFVDVRDNDGTLHRLIYEPELYNTIIKLTEDMQAPLKQIDEAFAEVKKFTRGINEGDGVISRLISDPIWVTQINDTLVDMRKASEVLRVVFVKINEGDGVLTKLLNDEKIGQGIDNAFAALDSVSNDMKKITSRMVEGEGTLGKLLAKSEFYEEMSNLLGEVRGAVEDSREFVPVTSALSVLFGTAR
ncbi:MAG: MlaD family protein [Planctomycetota bacterium]